MKRIQDFLTINYDEDTKEETIVNLAVDFERIESINSDCWDGWKNKDEKCYINFKSGCHSCVLYNYKELRALWIAYMNEQASGRMIFKQC